MTALHHVCIGMFGLIAGFFYAYSVSAMPGLGAVDPNAAIEAMRGINVAVLNPVFFATFFVTPVLALIAGGLRLRAGSRAAGMLLLAAALVYILGAMGPTSIVNVPMNEALAMAEIVDPAVEWSAYSRDWTLANHARTVASLTALGLTSEALRRT
ncbi:MAG: anthrone oxygenase family protein [Pseudomonadota bacterium]